MGGCRLWRAILAVSCVIGGTVAQVVRVEARDAFSGWVATTVDKAPPHPCGVVTAPDGETTLYVLGRRTGLDTHAIDVRVSLAAGERVALDLSKALPADWKRAPPHPLEHYGGWPCIAGVPMDLRGFDPDGAGYRTHWRLRTGRMFVTDLWLTTYPDQGWMRGEATVTASNPTVPDLFAYVPPGFTLTFGDAVVTVPGRSADTLIEAGTVFADGQSRILPLFLAWSRLGGVPAQAHAVGIRNLLHDGNPTLPAGFEALAWANGHRAGAEAVLHSWTRPVVGVNPMSGDTGAQEDQVFVRAEPLQHERAVWVTYLSALKLANRPCHHREANGDLLNHLGHTSPRLVLWDMRPHRPSVSPDQLGKPPYPFGDYPAFAAWDIPGGWFGMDVEHAFANTLFTAARYTGSPALQNEMATLARNYLFQWTTLPGLTTSQPFASRAIGWEGILAVHLWRDLEDRALAARVRDRWCDRFKFIIGPALNAPDVRARGDIWTTHTDSQLGPGVRWQPWQQAVGAYGLDLAGKVFGEPDARKLALRGARVALRAYELRNGNWTTRNNLLVSGEQDQQYGVYDLFACPLAAQLVLLHEPNDTVESERAREVWANVKARGTEAKHRSWWAPGVAR